MSRQWTFPKYNNLDEAVKRFFELLDTRETNDDVSREFSPVYISSTRVFMTAELESLLPQMKELAGYDKSNTRKNLSSETESLEDH